MKKLLVLLTLLFPLLVGSVAAQSWTATPGDGVGAVTVGMSPTALKTILKPTRVIGAARNPALVEYGKELIVEYDSNKAVIISLHNNSFNTNNGRVQWVPYKGAAIGASWSSVASQITGRKVSRALPTAKGHPQETYHAYPSLGIGFRVKGGSITQVDLWKGR